MELSIKLRDHFDNDTVGLYLNGEEIYQKSGVTSDLSISFADSIEVSVTEPFAKLLVRTGKGPSQEKSINIQDTPFVDIWFLEGNLSILTSRQEMPIL